MVLNGLGWKIRRIWSTEWWMDAASATEKIHIRLTADLESDRASRPSVQPEAAKATAEKEAAQEEIHPGTGSDTRPSVDVASRPEMEERGVHRLSRCSVSRTIWSTSSTVSRG
jgi:hypothetical protein